MFFLKKVCFFDFFIQKIDLELEIMQNNLEKTMIDMLIILN